MSDSGKKDVTWTEEALRSLDRAPIFLRGMVKKLAEKRAREEGVSEIDEDRLSRWKNEMMGGGEVPAKAEKGFFWTAKATERLGEVPEFMREIVRRIVEEVAREEGHLEVGADFFARVESLGFLRGEGDEEPAAVPSPAIRWTDEALARLGERVAQTPPMAKEFAFQMLREDVEEIAEKKGCAEVTADLLTRIWEEAPRGVSWSPEAWERLQTAPEFVRSGIKKAAERRARKAGAVEITSGMLTRFRNEAMMKAVMRIRRLGFTELTFEAFDAAKEKVKRLQNNEEAEERLEHIRAYMTGGDRSSGDILGKDIMERFRRYLKGEENSKP